MAKTESLPPFGGDVAEQRYSELFDRYKQHLGWLGVLIIVAGLGVWFYFRSEAIKTQRAEAAFQSAVQSVSTGNLPLAQSDLKKAASRYEGTDGGSQASMALAKIYYQQGKYQDGIAALKGPDDNGGDLQYEARMLTATGYEGMLQWAQAATEYEAAASIARFDADKANAHARAARAYQIAGNKPAAIKIWTELAAEPTGGFVTEAAIRLGELEAAPVKG